MLQIGKNITQKDDPMSDIKPEQLSASIAQPDETTATLIARLRLIKTIDIKQYNVLKRTLPYVVCGIFAPAYRRIENFGYIEYFMVDIDHITEKGLEINLIKAQLKADSRVVMCFVSPSEDGLKCLFKLDAKCYDSGQYSTFYKIFVRALSQQYGLDQVVDTRTSDVSRACFISYDPEVYYNPFADAISMSDFVDFNNPFAISQITLEINKEEKAKVTEKQEKREPTDEAMLLIKQKLGNRLVNRIKPQVYVPEELNTILSSLLDYVKESGVVVDEVEDIQYGKKFKLHLGIKKAEVNLFFGRRGYTVVKSPRTGTNDQLNDLMTEYIKAFVNDLYSDNAELSEVASIRQQATELQNKKDYANAVPLFKTLWEKHHDECDEWDGWRYAYCLKQLKDYTTALNVCREVYKIKNDFVALNGLYAWCIYYTEIAIPRIVDEATFFRAGEGILRLCIQNDKYSPYTMTIFKIITYLAGRKQYPTDKILEWTGKLNPELLETDVFAFTDSSGKKREMASKKEQYYAWRSKALLEKGLYEDCIALSLKALELFNNLHYDNDVWFGWRIALAHIGLGQKDLALDELKRLLARKNEWFIQKEIAEILFSQGKADEALKYAVDGALCSGDDDKKVNLYKLIVTILQSIGKTIEAQKIMDRQNIRQILETIKFGEKKAFTGIIKSILPNGKSGFVETDGQKSYYFKLSDFKCNREKAKQGQRVTFYLEEGFDAKKGRKTMNAVNLKLR
ncbi:MAG: hypothetical protein LBQ31_11080 [Bacteroidales bacterium]|jgi:tetratricopeptide (TPR) repeat protein/cold shock CspA family protein|nr:hypothetical protein [Bacteroidales bacterium]